MNANRKDHRYESTAGDETEEIFTRFIRESRDHVPLSCAHREDHRYRVLGEYSAEELEFPLYDRLTLNIRNTQTT